MSNESPVRSSPPKWALNFLRWICPEHLHEEIEGDLIQRFERDNKIIGVKGAKRKFVWNSIRFFRPGIVLRNRFSIRLNQWGMLSHFFKIFFRTSLKNGSYSFLNISGLVLGMTAFLLISLYVWKERSYDDFHIKKDKIFRVRHDRYTNHELTRQWSAGPMGIGSDLKDNFPEVVRYTRLNKGWASPVLANGATYFKEEHTFFASEDFFKIFSFPLIKQTGSTVLHDPFTMVVSESFARRYFGEQEPLGKTLKSNGKEEYTITGVFKDVPENSHLKFDALFSYQSLLIILGPKEVEDLMTNWGWEGNYTYIELNDPSSASSLQAKLPAFIEKQMGERLREWNEGMGFVLQPINSIHLDSHTPDELEANGDRKSIQYLMLIAVFILLMAWINYINLATARVTERAREVGVRKVLGTGRAQLISQFLLESFATKLVALVLTIALIACLFPWFSDLTNKKPDWSAFSNGKTWLFVAVIFILGVIGSGLYPAMVLSGLRPMSILKGNFKNSVTGNYLRKGLVTVQFVSFVVLIVSTVVIYKQIKFMRESASGVDMEQVLVVHCPTVTDSTFSARYKGFRQSLLNYADIKKVTVSTDVPGHYVRNNNGGVRLVGKEIREGNSYQAIMTDENFISTYGLKLVAGHNFSGSLNEVWRAAIVNETAMKLLGMNNPEEILGRKVFLWDSTPEIIGVIKDFHQESVKKKIKPLILVYEIDLTDCYYSIKINTNKPLSESVDLAEAKYKEAFPGNPFHYFFLDDHYNNQYQADLRFGSIFGLFTLVAILISCLGLFGLSSYTVVQRAKEIGIRKVLGASVKQITVLISAEFIVIVLLANVIAWPIAYIAMNRWLNDFASRIDLGLLSFLVPGAIGLIIAVITVSTQSIKAACADPVKSLKNE